MTGGQPTSKKDQYLLSTLKHGLEVLLLFSARRSVLSSKIVSESLGFGKSKAFKILQTLLSLGFLRRQENGHGYVLGPAVLELGLISQEQFSVPGLAAPILAELASSTGETAALTLRRGHQSVVVAAEDSHFSVRAVVKLGDRSPIHAGGSNIPLLAFGPSELREEFIGGSVELKRYTQNTVSISNLDRLITVTRDRGYHVSNGEVETAMMAIGAPVLDSKGAAQYCCSITGPAYRISPRLEELVGCVLSAAHQIELIQSSFEGGGAASHKG